MENWDYDVTIAVSANTGTAFKHDVYAPFVRLTYTNGATPQTAFRLHARFSSSGSR
jgi:hypothetical protein